MKHTLDIFIKIYFRLLANKYVTMTNDASASNY